MNQTCGRFFWEWQEDLEDEKGLWIARCMQTNKWFRNAEMRDFLGCHSVSVIDWPTASMRNAPEERRAIEDTHERVLVTGSTDTNNFTLTDNQGEVHDMVGSWTAARCEECPQRCAVIVGRVWPAVSTKPERQLA